MEEPQISKSHQSNPKSDYDRREKGFSSEGRPDGQGEELGWQRTGQVREPIVERLEDHLPTAILHDAIQETEAENIDYATNDLSASYRTQGAFRRFNAPAGTGQTEAADDTVDESLDFEDYDDDKDLEEPFLLSILNQFILSKKEN